MPQERILIVEDDPVLVDLLTEILTSANYEVRALESAFGAADLVRQLHPSAVLLDLGLPFRPGTALLSELKSDPRTAEVPVIIVSGLTDVLTEERSALAAAVVSKPFDAGSLVDTIRKVGLHDPFADGQNDVSPSGKGA
jgi:putative two-component system response regulator